MTGAELPGLTVEERESVCLFVERQPRLKSKVRVQHIPAEQDWHRKEGNSKEKRQRRAEAGRGGQGGRGTAENSTLSHWPAETLLPEPKL